MDKTMMCEAASRTGAQIVPYGYYIQIWYCKCQSISRRLDFYKGDLGQSDWSFFSNRILRGHAVTV
jgi:hypothetical protein